MLSGLFKAGLDAIVGRINMSTGPVINPRDLQVTAGMFRTLLDAGEEATGNEIFEYIRSKGLKPDWASEFQLVYMVVLSCRLPSVWAADILDQLREKAGEPQPNVRGSGQA